MTRVQKSRAQRLRRWRTDPTRFIADLTHEIRLAQQRATAAGLPLAVRLNILSDIPWEQHAPQLFATFPKVRFYDYTKWKTGRDVLPANYALTYSYDGTEESWQYATAALAAGRNVAVVFAPGTRPRKWRGIRVINGDLHDERWRDPRSVIVGLTAKGRAKHVRVGGFVVDGRRE